MRLWDDDASAHAHQGLNFFVFDLALCMANGDTHKWMACYTWTKRWIYPMHLPGMAWMAAYWVAWSDTVLRHPHAMRYMYDMSFDSDG